MRPNSRTVTAMARNPNGGGLFSDRVHQATGMVSAQQGCNLAEALGRMIIRARATDRSLERTASDVIDRVIRFTP
jgi:hypothetical protein